MVVGVPQGLIIFSYSHYIFHKFLNSALFRRTKRTYYALYHDRLK